MKDQTGGSKRTAIYCRVSTESQAANDKSSLDLQERRCRARATEDGLEVLEEYVVRDSSSGSIGSDDRKVLQRLFAGAERGEFDAVVFDLVDRTSRGGMFEFTDICNRFLRFNVKLLWATDRDIDLNTSNGQLIAGAKAWGAGQEKEAMVRRLRLRRQHYIASGHLDRATIPYGYRWTDTERTQYEPDPATAPIVVRIFHDIIAGVSATKLCRIFEEAGIPTPGQVKGRDRSWLGDKPSRWVVPTIASLLHNPVYKGERAHNRYVSIKRPYKEQRDRQLRSQAKITQRSPDQWTLIPVPPLVSANLWDQAQASYHANGSCSTKVTKRYTPEDALLYGGYVRCAHCGYAMTPHRHNIDLHRRITKRNWLYSCRHQELTSEGTRCKGAYITCTRLDALVWAEAAHVVADPVHRARFLEHGHEVWSPQTQLDHYTVLLAQVDQDDADIARELVRIASKPQLEHIRVHLEQEAARHAELRAGYTAKLDAAQAELTRRTTQDTRVQAFAEWASERSLMLATITADQRREILVHSFHPTVFVARKDSKRPRILLVFSTTPEAVAQLEPRELYTTNSWQGAHSEYYVVAIDKVSEPTHAQEPD